MATHLIICIRISIVICIIVICNVWYKWNGQTAALFSRTPRLRNSSRHVVLNSTNGASRDCAKVRVLCWVMTSPETLMTRASTVRETWGGRCDKTLYISSKTNETFPTIGLNVSEGRRHLTMKTMKAFQLIYEEYLQVADWFLKADDDTYVIVENLKYFLCDKNADTPVYFGHKFKQGGTYHSGGSGYVLSREALVRFGQHSNKFCHKDGGSEDWNMGVCMRSLRVSVVDTVDESGGRRFLCLGLNYYLLGNFPDWFYKYDFFGASKFKGLQAVSKEAISIHYVSSTQMLELEYYIYKLKIHIPQLRKHV